MNAEMSIDLHKCWNGKLGTNSLQQCKPGIMINIDLVVWFLGLSSYPPAYNTTTRADVDAGNLV